MTAEEILVIGAGTFGLSTGLHLLRKGCTNVTLIDPYLAPSDISAGNDVNKIFQSTSRNKFYGKLALDALEVWKSDPVFKPAFHETGIVYAAKDSIEYLKSSENFKKEIGLKVEHLSSVSDFEKLVPSLKDDSTVRFKDWEGYYQTDKCGWVLASLALESSFREIQALGGKFIQGSVKSILYSEDGSVAGVVYDDNKFLPAEKVVVSAGAQSYQFLDFKGQLLAKCWTVGHIKLTNEEAATIKNLPVFLSYDHGFLFEPDSNNELKFCNEFPGYINIDAKTGESIPEYRNQVPVEAEKYMREFLREVFPSISQRAFAVSKICWCTDTADRHFLIGTHPEHKGLILGTGDSGQGFKFMPIIGDYVSSVVIGGDDALSEDKRELWKWRPETAVSRDNFALQNRSGGTNVIKDLKDITEWTDGSSLSVSDLKL